MHAIDKIRIVLERLIGKSHMVKASKSSKTKHLKYLVGQEINVFDLTIHTNILR